MFSLPVFQTVHASINQIWFSVCTNTYPAREGLCCILEHQQLRTRTVNICLQIKQVRTAEIVLAIVEFVLFYFREIPQTRAFI